VSAEHGHAGNIRLLLEFGARIDLKDSLGLSPLDLARKGGHGSCAALLQAAQASEEAARLETFSSLMEAVLDCDLDRIVDAFKDLKEDLEFVINLTVGGSNTLLFK